MSYVTLFSNATIEESKDEKFCNLCGKECMEMKTDKNNEKKFVCENCDTISNHEEPLFIIKTKIYSDLLSQSPATISENPELWAKLMNFKASKSIQTDYIEPENIDNIKEKHSDLFEDEFEDNSVEIFNYTKFDYDAEFKTCVPEEKPKKKKYSISKYVEYKNIFLSHPMVKIGHKECIIPDFRVPCNQGWSWDLAKINQFGAGWVPGAINRQVCKIMKIHRDKFSELNIKEKASHKKTSAHLGVETAEKGTSMMEFETKEFA